MTFRMGWVGCGRQATEMLLPQLVTLDDVELAALADTDDRALSRTAARYGVDATFSNVTEFFEQAKLNGIGIAVGPDQHPKIAIEALGRDLPVFMEKPPATDLAGAEAIAAAARSADKPVLLGFMKRFSTGNKIAKNLLDPATFGPSLGVTASYMTAPSYFESNPDYASFFLHHCIHYLDLLPWLMGAPITDISARKVEHVPGKLLVHLSLAFSSGAIGTLVMGTIQSRGGPVESIEIMGDHRRVEINNVTDVRYVRDAAFKVEDANATLDDAADSLCWTPNFTVAANEDHKGYHALLQASLDAMQGRPSGAPTIDDGVRAMTVLETMKAALGRAS